MRSPRKPRLVRLRLRGGRVYLRSLAMIPPETLNHIESIKKRAGHLWRFL
jgi:hypothetical protein